MSDELRVTAEMVSAALRDTAQLNFTIERIYLIRDHINAALAAPSVEGEKCSICGEVGCQRAHGESREEFERDRFGTAGSCAQTGTEPPASVTGKPSEAGQWDVFRARSEEIIRSVAGQLPHGLSWTTQVTIARAFAEEFARVHAAAASNLSARAAEARLEEVGWWRSRIDGYDELFDGRIAELESAIDTPSKEKKIQ